MLSKWKKTIKAVVFLSTFIDFCSRNRGLKMHLRESELDFVYSYHILPESISIVNFISLTHTIRGKMYLLS